MVKDIEIVDVNKEEESNEPETTVNIEEEQKEENTIVEEETKEELKEEEPKEEPVEEQPTKELKSKTYSTEKVECPKCKKYVTKYTFRYRHNCNGIPVKKEPDPNKVVRRKLCIQNKQNNLRIMYMKKLKIIFPKLMNKK